MDCPRQTKLVNCGLAREERGGSEQLFPGLPDEIRIHRGSAREEPRGSEQLFPGLPDEIRIHRGSAREERRGSEPLFPGLPDEISVHHIATKLSWENLLSLSLVGPQWRQVIRSRKVYDARMKYDSSLKHVFVGHHVQFRPSRSVDGRPSRTVEGRPRLSMYSVDDDRIYHLPGLPVDTYRWNYTTVLWLEGKVYCFGGRVRSHRTPCDVFALDVVGYGGWERCASMHILPKQRSVVYCVAKGKVYEIDGTTKNLASIEVYDPREDSWSRIYMVKPFEDINRSVVVGDEIFWNRYSDELCAVYNISKDEWGMSNRFVGSKYMEGLDDHRIITAANGQLHRLKSEGNIIWIEVYDVPTNSWILSQVNPSPHDMTETFQSFLGLAMKRLHRSNTYIAF